MQLCHKKSDRGHRVKKIAILTPFDNNNYGNRLQNYAVQKILEKYGYKCDTLVLNRRKKTCKFIPHGIKLVIEKYGLNKRTKLDKDRYTSFSCFTKEYLSTKWHCFFYSEKKLNLAYDYFIIGSDQIWNPVFGANSPLMFLPFVDIERKIALSPSFGVSRIPENRKTLIENGIRSVKKLSVREDAGAELIYNIIGKRVPVLIDPTMMLTSEEWMQIENCRYSVCDTKFLLTYFLGGIPQAQQDRINNIAELYQLKVINMNQTTEPNIYIAGPKEFLTCIHQASLVCTDSFHACVFSILYETPFLIFERDKNDTDMSMGSRLETLTNKFGLQNRYENKVKPDEVMNVNYCLVRERLSQERKAFEKYLQECIHINN